MHTIRSLPALSILALALVTFLPMPVQATPLVQHAPAPAQSLGPPDAWPMAGHDAQATSFNPEERRISRVTIAHLQRAWSSPNVQQVIATATRVFAFTATPALGRPTVVILDARTGHALHRISLEALHLRVSYAHNVVLVYAQGRLLVGTATAVVALDPETGRLLWRVSRGADWLTAAGGLAFTTKGCPGACGSVGLTAIDLRTGRVRWSHSGNATGTPVLAAGHLYVQWGLCCNAPTHAYDAHTGRLVGVFPLGLANWTGDAHTAYVATGGPGGGTLTRLQGGMTRTWRVSFRPALLIGPPALAYHRLYVTIQLPDGRLRLVAIDAGTGRVLWRRPTRGPIALVANHLLVSPEGTSWRVPGVVIVHDADSGRKVGTIAIPGAFPPGQPTGPLALAGGTLYLIHFSGTLLALRPEGGRQ